MKERVILHCDCNGFYASVECLFRPELKEIPMAVAGNPENRHGIILAKNEPAQSRGVKTAETIWQARKKCPELVLVPPRHEKYREYSRKVNRIYQEFTDRIEPFGIDESWLDVTDVRELFGTGPEIAGKIRREVRERLGLTVSVGVSFNKVFAKMGSDYRKPDATTVISRENFKEILFPLPVGNLFFVGRVTAGELEKLGIRTIGDLAAADRQLLKARLGKTGEMIWEYAGGLDESPVEPPSGGWEGKSVGHGMTFRRNLTGWEDIRLGLTALSDQVARRLRRQGVRCATVSVMIKDPSFHVISRQKTLETPTFLARDIAATALELVRKSWDLKTPVRMLTVTAENLTEEVSGEEQLSFLEPLSGEEDRKQEQLEAAVDRIREKYGGKAISRAGILKNDLGIEE